ncbi:2,3-bisphosphoglycerate-dependent phosphoglycerate mutase [Rhizobium sp. Nf11,1]|uniref:2,3-bisphosphoglycerate-dependent phosphoglycerate mutase n=1 Tax=Rhizobium sp. Nf11,1 TaxID=3404923 RepID=UPI003D32EB52
MERLLVLIRHGQSEGNANHLFTGWNDPELTPQGVFEAEAIASALGDTRFDIAFTSSLRRAQHTLQIILHKLGQSELTTVESPDLNERNYGDLTGLRKAEARSLWGKDFVDRWQRSYDLAPPEGESLRDTSARVVPYFITRVLPCVLSGERTIIAAHGNSLRALVMVLEQIDPGQIATMEISTGTALLYKMNADGTVCGKRTYPSPVI